MSANRAKDERSRSARNYWYTVVCEQRPRTTDQNQYQQEHSLQDNPLSKAFVDEHFADNMCIYEPQPASESAHARADHVIQQMIDQLQATIANAKHATADQMVYVARLGSETPAIRTIRILSGVERKRLANLAIECLSSHTQAEEKAKHASPASIYDNAAARASRLSWLPPTLITRDAGGQEQKYQPADGIVNTK